MVEVRGRVDGYIEQRAFEIGSDVRPGRCSTCWTGVPTRPTRTHARRARPGHGRIAQAEANLTKAEQDADGSRRW